MLYLLIVHHVGVKKFICRSFLILVTNNAQISDTLETLTLIKKGGNK